MTNAAHEDIGSQKTGLKTFHPSNVYLDLLDFTVVIPTRIGSLCKTMECLED